MSAPAKFRKRIPGTDTVNDTKRYLDILGRAWSVTFMRAGLVCGGEIVYGLCSYDTQTIAISADCAREVQRQAVFHEIVHAVCRTVRQAGANDEESFVRDTETGIYQVLRHPDNAWFLEFLLEENVYED